MTHTIISSPLQGFTDFRFRNAFNKFFGGIDTFYAPYIRLTGKDEIKSSNEKDILLQNNIGTEIIPQIMTNDANDFLFVVKFVQQFGYKELNWNLGCPYPMVTKRALGSGFIKEFEKINEILNKVHSESNIIVSIKTRLGYDNNEEIFRLLPVLDKYPIKNITIHPRIGKQLYKGNVDLDSFQKCLEITKHKICFNGDITSVSVFNELQERFPTIDHWLIGRGLIADPFLPSMIKNNTTEYPQDRFEIFEKFHNTLFQDYSSALSGSSHLLMKMLGFWEYFSLSFSNPHKALKKIKKAKGINAFEIAVKEILHNEVV